MLWRQLKLFINALLDNTPANPIIWQAVIRAFASLTACLSVSLLGVDMLSVPCCKGEQRGSHEYIRIQLWSGILGEGNEWQCARYPLKRCCVYQRSIPPTETAKYCTHSTERHVFRNDYSAGCINCLHLAKKIKTYIRRMIKYDDITLRSSHTNIYFASLKSSAASYAKFPVRRQKLLSV